MKYYEKSILESNTLEELKSAVEYKHHNLIASQSLYSGNSLGFRDTEILNDVDVCYYGCSITYGLGVSVDNRWTNLVDNTFKFRSNNFGVPGASTEDIAHLFISTSKFITTKTAIFLLPDTLRSTLPVEHDNDVRYIKTYADFTHVYKRGSEEYKLCDLYYKIPNIVHTDRTRCYIDIIINWAKLKNIKIIIASWAWETLALLNNIEFENLTILRNQMLLDNNGDDGSHPGVDSHKNLALNVIKVINNELQGTI